MNSLQIPSIRALKTFCQRFFDKMKVRKSCQNLTAFLNVFCTMPHITVAKGYEIFSKFHSRDIRLRRAICP